METAPRRAARPRVAWMPLGRPGRLAVGVAVSAFLLALGVHALRGAFAGSPAALSTGALALLLLAGAWTLRIARLSRLANAAGARARARSVREAREAGAARLLGIHLAAHALGKGVLIGLGLSLIHI